MLAIKLPQRKEQKKKKKNNIKRSIMWYTTNIIYNKGDIKPEAGCHQAGKTILEARDDK